MRLTLRSLRSTFPSAAVLQLHFVLPLAAALHGLAWIVGRLLRVHTNRLQDGQIVAQALAVLGSIAALAWVAMQFRERSRLPSGIRQGILMTPGIAFLLAAAVLTPPLTFARIWHPRARQALAAKGVDQPLAYDLYSAFSQPDATAPNQWLPLAPNYCSPREPARVRSALKALSSGTTAPALICSGGTAFIKASDARFTELAANTWLAHETLAHHPSLLDLLTSHSPTESDVHPVVVRGSFVSSANTVLAFESPHHVLTLYRLAMLAGIFAALGVLLPRTMIGVAVLGRLAIEAVSPLAERGADPRANFVLFVLFVLALATLIGCVASRAGPSRSWLTDGALTFIVGIAVGPMLPNLTRRIMWQEEYLLPGASLVLLSVLHWGYADAYRCAPFSSSNERQRGSGRGVFALTRWLRARAPRVSVYVPLWLATTTLWLAVMIFCRIPIKLNSLPDLGTTLAAWSAGSALVAVAWLARQRSTRAALPRGAASPWLWSPFFATISVLLLLLPGEYAYQHTRSRIRTAPAAHDVYIAIDESGGETLFNDAFTPCGEHLNGNGGPSNEARLAMRELGWDLPMPDPWCGLEPILGSPYARNWSRLQPAFWDDDERGQRWLTLGLLASSLATCVLLVELLPLLPATVGPLIALVTASAGFLLRFEYATAHRWLFGISACVTGFVLLLASRHQTRAPVGDLALSTALSLPVSYIFLHFILKEETELRLWSYLVAWTVGLSFLYTFFADYYRRLPSAR